MADQTNIEWTDSTFNPWIGCTKVSPACDNCYAEALMDKRHHRVQWGPHGERDRTSEGNWQNPRRWQKQAAAFFGEHGRRRRVFCASLADVFDNKAPAGARDDLWLLIRETPDLDWLLLTKRPQNIAKMLPVFWPEIAVRVWLGTSTENQEEVSRRLPHLLAVDPRPAAFFASAEPLLGPIDFKPWLPGCHECAEECGWRDGAAPGGEVCRSCGIMDPQGFDEFCSACGSRDIGGVCPDCEANVVHHHPDTPCLDWIITGGESGHDARPTYPDWIRSIRDQCAAAGTAFLLKQWGEWAPTESAIGKHVQHALANDGTLYRAADLAFPDGAARGAAIRADHDGAHLTAMYRVGKKAAGRLLDGVQHDGYPESAR